MAAYSVVNEKVELGIKEFAYRVDCGNIVRKSCCGRMDAPTVQGLFAWLSIFPEEFAQSTW